jgi:hypothetical protein
VPFLVFLKSFEDLLYELMSWLVFYPRTLWRSVRHPLEMMARGEQELKEPPQEQFNDLLSPPIFLLLTILLAHGFELALIGNSDLIDKDGGLASLISDNTSLILFRIVMFASLPIVVGAFSLWTLGRPLDRTTLQPVFYAQCFVTTPEFLFYSIAGTLSRLENDWAKLGSAVLLLAGTVFYFGVQAAWFKRELKRGWGIGVACAGAVFVITILLLAFSALLFAGD